MMFLNKPSWSSIYSNFNQHKPFLATELNDTVGAVHFKLARQTRGLDKGTHWCHRQGLCATRIRLLWQEKAIRPIRRTSKTFISSYQSFNPWDMDTLVGFLLQNFASKSWNQLRDRCAPVCACARMQKRQLKSIEFDATLTQIIFKLKQRRRAAPVVFRSYKHVTLHFCKGYCKLDAIIGRNSFPTVPAAGFMGVLGEATLFSVPNLYGCY